LAKNIKLYLVSGGKQDMGLNCAIGLTKWTKSEIMGTWTLGYLGFLNDFRMKKESGCPNQGQHGLRCQENKVIKCDDKNLSKCWKQRLLQLPNK
jgi:hypothetical protein